MTLLHTKLLDQMRLAIRLRHLSQRTEQAYINWSRRFILFHHKRHPKEMGAEEIRAFLTHLAVNSRVAASTQNVALNALLFLYRHVLHQDFPPLDTLERAKRPRRVPTVFTREEVAAILAQLTGMNHLMACLLYGAGLRLMECLRLRVKDVDFASHQITVRHGKGAQDRVTMLPQAIAEPLQRHLARVKLFHEADLLDGYGEVFLPYAFDRKDPSRRHIVAVAVCLSRYQTLCRSALGRRTATPYSGDSTAKSREGRYPPRRGAEARQLPYVAPQFRHPFAGRWL